MRACIIQPPYSTDYARSDELFSWELARLDECNDSLDLIVLPESCDVPALAKNKEEHDLSCQRYNDAIVSKARETAKRCQAVVFINANHFTPTGPRNTTYAINKNGDIVGYYYKEHLVRSETEVMKLDSEYTFDFFFFTVIEIDGLKYGFLTCYDFYFYEAYSNIARKNVDIIIGCSHQRSDTHDAVEIITRFIAYNCNAYVVRASVSMDENSNIGGGSMIVAPTGKVLANMYSKVGMAYADFDPLDKYYKPAGYGNPPAAHYQYVEIGRRPWKYRPAGSAIARTDALAKYPRVCADGGLVASAPLHSLPSIGSAVAIGVDEVRLRLYPSADGEPVACASNELSDYSDIFGKIWDIPLKLLKSLELKSSQDGFEGLCLATFENILFKFSCHTIMNLFIEPTDAQLDEKFLKRIFELIEKYDCKKYVYFTSPSVKLLERLKLTAPEFPICLYSESANKDDVKKAVFIGCEKIEANSFIASKEFIDTAHSQGLRCLIDCQSDGTELLSLGADVIVTPRCLQTKNALKSK